MSVNKENMRKFIWTLRSGFYKQNFNNSLRDIDNNFCPRGVLRDMANFGWGGLVAPALWDGQKSAHYAPILAQEERDQRLCGDAEANFLGISVDEIFQIGRRNVREHLSFNEHADYLEKTYLPEDWKKTLDSKIEKEMTDVSI